MQKTIFELDGRRVLLYADEAPALLFLQPIDARDTDSLDRQLDAMEGCALPFVLAAFRVADWNRDLSPWEAPPVFGKTPFGGGAAATLAFLTERLLPELSARIGAETLPVCLGGYSLAGLFALWAAAESDRFSGVAGVSPSVWFPGWLDWVKAHPLRADFVYLSLGDREERTKNPVMARVGDCIRELYALLRDDHAVTLDWNPGNHFQQPEARTAKGLCRLAAQLAEDREARGV